jgi:hypothetical protein
LTGTTDAPHSPQKRVSLVYCLPQTGQMVRVIASVLPSAGTRAAV